jgi:hypothetical protein
LDRQRSVATLIGVAAVALALVSAACGGGGSKGDSDGVASLGGNSQQSASGNEQGEMDPEEAMLAFARCMREHGVNIPDPTRSGEGGGFRFRSGARGPDPSSAKFREAERACQRFLEQAKPLNLSEEDRAAMQDAVLEYAKCMRRHGVDMPDPDFSGPGIKLQLPKGVGPDNPRFEAAQKACQSILQDAQRKAGLGEGRLEERGRP